MKAKPKTKVLTVLMTINLVLLTLPCFSQGVAINTTGSAASSSAMLDVSSADQGILIPRLSLTQSTSPAPVSNPVASLMVYNIATANDVTPGFYYWDGTKWLPLAGGGISDADLRAIKTKIYTNVGGK